MKQTEKQKDSCHMLGKTRWSILNMIHNVGCNQNSTYYYGPIIMPNSQVSNELHWVHNTNYVDCMLLGESTPSLFTSQTVYHLKVNWVQVPFNKITQQRSVKTISSPTLSADIDLWKRQMWNGRWVEDGEFSKATEALFIESKQQSHNMSFMSYFGVLWMIF